MTLIAEDLLLLLLDDDSGRLVQQSFADQALAGAVIAELAEGGHVRLVERRWSDPLVERAPIAKPHDPVLADAAREIEKKSRTAPSLLGPVGKGLRARLAERLVERGILRREDDKVLGLFPRTSWPTVDARHEEEVRAEIGATLLHGEPPGPRAAAPIGLLHAVGLAHKVIDRGDVSASEVKKRAKAVAEGDLASEAVSSAVQGVYTAVFTATIVPAIVTSGSS